MSIKIGGSKSKSKSTSNTNTSTTTTPVLPSWASGLTQSVAGRIGGLMGLDPQTLVAPQNPLQTQAAYGAAGLNTGTSWLRPYLGAGAPTASGGEAHSFVGKYLNPYLQQVVDTSANDFDANAGQVRAQQALDLAGSGAFGGSGAALTRSMTEGELSRARASTLSGLRSQAYNTALGAAAGDADRATQARIANAQMALQDRAQKVGWVTQADANARANIEAQAGMGEALRGIDQQVRQAPISNTQQIVAMLQGLPLSLFTGEQKTGVENRVATEKGKNISGEVSHTFT